MQHLNGTIPPRVLADDIEARAWADFFAAAPPDLGCASHEVPGTRATLLAAPRLPSPLLNRVIGLSTHDLLDDACLDWIAQTYREAGTGSFWLHGWPPDDGAQAPASLRRRGWANTPSQWRKFLYDLDAPLPAMAPATGLLARPASKDDAATAGGIICASHGLPESMTALMASVVGRRRWQVFLACRADGAPVAAAALFIDGAHAWLGMGSTLSAARRQGAQQLLLRVRLAAARAAGCRTAAVETGAPRAGEPSPSLNNIRRAGFRDVGGRINWPCTA